MLGVNLLVRLARHTLAGAVADSGLLPAGLYRHLALEALEDDDFPQVLKYVQWAGDPVLVQLLVLRLRLLAARHARERRAILEVLEADNLTGSEAGPLTDEGPGPRRDYQALLQAQDQALEL